MRSATVAPYLLPDDIDFQFLVQRAFENNQDEPGIASNVSSPLSSAPSSPEILPMPLPEAILSPITPQYSAPMNGTEEPPKPSAPMGAKPRSKHRSKQNRQKKRAAAKAKTTPETYMAPPPKKPRVQRDIQLDIDLDQLRASENGFTGYHTQYSDEKYALEDVTGPNSRFKFTKIDWDAKSDFVLVTRDGYEITHGIGFADQNTWPDSAVRVADKLDSERENTSYTEKFLSNRRGEFFALSAGVSCDQGMKKPKVVGQATAKNATVIDRLLLDADVVRLAGYQSAAFYHCQPVLYHQYAENRTRLKGNQPDLTWNFRNSIYAHVTFNFGPRTVCIEHTDFGNRADGPCAITALSPSVGGYDYRKGGHLILWDLRLVIEFPPGATVLILSAVLRHSNVAIGDDERRFSFTQYTAGSLFRWVERGYRLETDFWASLTKDEAKAEKAKNKTRWKNAFLNFARHNS